MNLKKYQEVIIKPLIDENPITLQILGICSALAVTNNLAVTLVTVSYTHLTLPTICSV